MKLKSLVAVFILMFVGLCTQALAHELQTIKKFRSSALDEFYSYAQRLDKAKASLKVRTELLAFEVIKFIPDLKPNETVPQLYERVLKYVLNGDSNADGRQLTIISRKHCLKEIRQFLENTIFAATGNMANIIDSAMAESLTVIIGTVKGNGLVAIADPASRQFIIHLEN